MKLVSLFKDKRFRYGTMSTAMMIVAIAIFILANLLADEFNQSWDLTAEQLYTLTPQSERFLEELDMDITISYVTRTGGETHRITQLLAQYAAASPRITTEQRDPTINPAFVHQFATDVGGGIPDGSVIVQSAHDYRVIRPQDMGTWQRHPQTGQNIRMSFEEEAEITQAIHSLTLGEPSVIYHITGSGELNLPQALISFLESENFIVRTHDAVLQDIPETADILFITMPSRDWGTAKADRILSHLDNNEGRAFFTLGASAERFPQMDRVLQAYGLQLGNYIVVERDADRTFMRELLGEPASMLPTWIPHEEITFPLALQGFTGMLLLRPTGLDILDMRRETTTIEPLLTTSRNADALVIASDPDSPEFIDGPFYLAVAVTDFVFVDTTHITRLVVMSDWLFMHEDFNHLIGGGNWAFISNSLNWLQDQPAGIWVPVRRPAGAAPIVISDAQVVGMTGVVMGILPVGLFAVGILVWFRRRHN